jgi:type I restriction enzyme, R subunit
MLVGRAHLDFLEHEIAMFEQAFKNIDAENSDLFDVLAHVAYAVPPVTREVRAANARVYINTEFSAKQQAFLDFVLQHYVNAGVEELDQTKLTPLLRLKYHHSISDAVADLGKPDDIGRMFAGFQRYLYAKSPA